MEKLDLITDSAMSGLTAKSAWYLEKLQNFADEKLQLFEQIDETCRIKLDDEMNAGRKALEDAAAASMTGMRECRLSYVEAVLKKKEELKGQLQNMVNETITNLKELKVDQALAGAGLPSGDPSGELEDAILAETTNFSNAVDTFVADQFETFFATGGPGATIETCLDNAEQILADAW